VICQKSNNFFFFLVVKMQDQNQDVLEAIYKYLLMIKKSDKKRKAELRKRLEKYFTNNIHFELFKQFPLNENTEIIRSESYIHFSYKNKVKRENYHHLRDDYVEIRKYAIIGINDDGKLFFNLVDFPLSKGFEEQSIRWGFEYDYDYHENQIIVVDDDNDEIRYRVQGDLVFGICIKPIETVIDDYCEIVMHRLVEQTENRLLQLLLDSIIRNFSLKRISVEADRIREEGITFRIPINRVKWEDLEKYESVIKSLTSEFVKEFLEYYNLDIYGYIDDDIYIRYRNVFGRNIGIFEVEVNLYRQKIGEQIWHKLLPLEKEIKDRLREVIDNQVEVVINHGNHTISYKGIPHNITFNYFNPIVNEDMQFVLHIPETFIYTTNNCIKVNHDEHKDVNVKLQIPEGSIGEIRIMNTRVSQNQTTTINKIVLKQYIQNQKL